MCLGAHLQNIIITAEFYMNIDVSNLTTRNFENFLLNHFESRPLRDQKGNPLPQYKHQKTVPYKYSHNSLSPEALNDISQSLTHNGIVIVENFLDQSTAEKCLNKIELAIGEVQHFIDAGEHGETKQLYVQNSSRDDRPYKTYNELASAEKPVINVRGGRTNPSGEKYDVGILDIFNVYDLNPYLKKTFAFLKSEKLIEAIGRGLNVEMFAGHSNAYINRGITMTRGFHLDNLVPSAKAFVYLTDVNSLDDGPYCYGLGTHANTKLRVINSIISEKTGLHGYDYAVMPEEDRLACLAPKGSLIISYQFGAHRGAPQKEGHSRALAVQVYGAKP